MVSAASNILGDSNQKRQVNYTNALAVRAVLVGTLGANPTCAAKSARFPPFGLMQVGTCRLCRTIDWTSPLAEFVPEAG